MKSLPVIRPLDVHYDRNSTFSYACNTCGRCCYHKIIHLNPYEVARLAQNRGIGTTEFLSRYTAANGTALKQQEDGGLRFPHPTWVRRPYRSPVGVPALPLGRRITAEGEEWFSEAAPHPESAGEYGIDGIVEEFLTKQGAQPFIKAVDRYVELVGQMSHLLLEKTAHDATLQHHVQNMVGGLAQEQDQEIPVMLDMDQVVERFCADQGMFIPSDVTERMNLHIQVIEEWLHED